MESACTAVQTTPTGFCTVDGVTFENTTDSFTFVNYTLTIDDWENVTITEEPVFDELVTRAENNNLLTSLVVRASSIVLGACTLFFFLV